MSKKRIKLKVASPCSANWDEMTGDAAVRHCQLCDKDVFQISNMSSEQVEEFLLSRKGKGTCARFYQRKDGTLLTSDCSVGKRRKRKMRVIGAFGAAAAAASAMVATAPSHQDKAPPQKRKNIESVELPPTAIMGKVVAEPDVVPVPPEPFEPVMGALVEEPYEEIMGDIAYDQPTDSIYEEHIDTEKGP